MRPPVKRTWATRLKTFALLRLSPIMRWLTGSTVVEVRWVPNPETFAQMRARQDLPEHAQWLRSLPREDGSAYTPKHDGKCLYS